MGTLVEAMEEKDGKEKHADNTLRGSSIRHDAVAVAAVLVGTFLDIDSLGCLHPVNVGPGKRLSGQTWTGH